MSQPVTLISTNAQDPRVQALCGIRRRHAERILAFTQGMFRQKSLIVVIRAANPESLRWHGAANHQPKPYGVETKTRRSGRVSVGDDGKFYFSDYDLFGVYEQRHTGDYVRLYVGNYQPNQEQPSAGIGSAIVVNTLLNPFLNEINKYVCRTFGDRDMFQHGSEDDYRLAGRPKLALKDTNFAAFDHTGDVTIMTDLAALKGYYHSRPGLAWVWPTV